MKGTIRPGNVLFLGPDHTGHFTPVTVRTIECRRLSCELAKVGQSVTLCIRSANRKLVIKRNYFRKGMMLVENGPDSVSSNSKKVDSNMPRGCRFVLTVDTCVDIYI